jgi:hypothetical protein
LTWRVNVNLEFAFVSRYNIDGSHFSKIEMVKRYAVIRRSHIISLNPQLSALYRLPPEFRDATGDRYLHIVGFLYSSGGQVIDDVSLHSNFITKNPDYNHLVCISSDEMFTRKKWKSADRDNIYFWFKDITGKDIDNEGPDAAQYWIIQLMLEYEP